MTKGRAVYFNFQADINHDTASKLISAIETKLQQGMTELVLLISSGGGFIDPGMAVYNFLRGIPAKVTTHNYGTVDSIAMVIYCAGKERLACPHCKFLIHGVTWTFSQAGVCTESQLREILGSLEKMKKNIASVIAVATGKPADKIEADMSRGLTLQANEAREYGLVHRLEETLFLPGAEVIGIR